MNFLRKIVNINNSNRCIQLMSSLSRKKSTYISENLSERTLIRIQGDEVIQFLQGLITNDMTHFERGVNSIYAMFLNKSGRVLHDSIIYKTTEKDTFLIETDKNGGDNLCRHLRLFRVRRKIDIDKLDSDYKVWTLFKNDIDDCSNISIKHDFKISSTANANEILICSDPRTKYLGVRLILPNQIEDNEFSNIFSSINILPSNSDNDYKLHRYKLGISEGMTEHQYEKILPFETNIDYLHGISFHKGCYLGQEVTARTYHTGVIRKRIMPIKLNTNQIPDNVKDVQTPNGKACGIIKGFKNYYCIAVVRVDQALQTECLFINGERCKLIIPDWWPKELPNKLKLKENQTK